MTEYHELFLTHNVEMTQPTHRTRTRTSDNFLFLSILSCFVRNKFVYWCLAFLLYLSWTFTISFNHNIHYVLIVGWNHRFPRDWPCHGYADVRRGLPRCGVQGQEQKSSACRNRRVFGRCYGSTARRMGPCDQNRTACRYSFAGKIYMRNHSQIENFIFS